MWKYRNHLARLTAVALLACAPAPLSAQVGTLDTLCAFEQRGAIKGVVSTRTRGKLYAAVWYAVPSKQEPRATENSLSIFEQESGRHREVFRLDDEGKSDWEHLLPFDSPRLPGFVLFSQSGDSDRGPATVVGLVKGKFQVVYEGGESEFVDLNADGIPEILESVWPDGDGFPTHTTVHVWGGQAYKQLMKVGWNERFSPAVRRSVEKAASKVTIP